MKKRNMLVSISLAALWASADAYAQASNEMYVTQPKATAQRNPWIDELRTQLTNCKAFGQEQSTEANIMRQYVRGGENTSRFAERNVATAAIDQNSNGQFDALLGSTINAYDSNTHQMARLSQMDAAVLYLTLELNRAGYVTHISTDMQHNRHKNYTDHLVRAIETCGPYDLPLERYEEWKVMGLDFRAPPQ